MNISPNLIERLLPNEIFVFGSNQAGAHGAGAALVARRKFGALDGVGRGITGRCYAIPTKDRRIRTLPLYEISEFVSDFLAHAAANPNQSFLVTQIGCGLAGYNPAQIAPLFFQHGAPPHNVALPAEFWINAPTQHAHHRS